MKAFLNVGGNTIDTAFYNRSPPMFLYPLNCACLRMALKLGGQRAQENVENGSQK
jgi:hypothetical protein